MTCWVNFNEVCEAKAGVFSAELNSPGSLQKPAGKVGARAILHREFGNPALIGKAGDRVDSGGAGMTRLGYSFF